MRKLAYLVLLGAALALFNPTGEDFSEYVEAHSELYLSKRTGDSRLGDVLSDLGGNVSRSLAAHLTERDNYGLFSIYKIDLDGPDESAEEWRFLGIAGRFFTLTQPEGLER